MKSNLPVDVEVGISGSLGGVEPVLVLRGCRPRGVGGRRGHHHEERLVVGFILEEVQRHVGLRERERERRRSEWNQKLKLLLKTV